MRQVSVCDSLSDGWRTNQSASCRLCDTQSETRGEHVTKPSRFAVSTCSDVVHPACRGIAKHLWLCSRSLQDRLHTFPIFTITIRNTQKNVSHLHYKPCLSVSLFFSNNRFRHNFSVLDKHTKTIFKNWMCSFKQITFLYCITFTTTILQNKQYFWNK